MAKDIKTSSHYRNTSLPGRLQRSGHKKFSPQRWRKPRGFESVGKSPMAEKASELVKLTYITYWCLVGMGEWDDYYYYGSFPHSLLSTSKISFNHLCIFHEYYHNRVACTSSTTLSNQWVVGPLVGLEVATNDVPGADMANSIAIAVYQRGI